MKICLAQIRPVKGDIQKNIDNHKKVIALAISNGADTIIFPELSITGYEPELAYALATTPADSRFDEFQRMSDAHQVTLGIGVPTKDNSGIYITMVLFRPNQTKQTYSKKYLHADEEPFFVSGKNTQILLDPESKAVLAICYEISVPEHAESAFKLGAEMYIASVAKSVKGMEPALERLAEIAEKFAMTVLMVNCVGYCDNFECGGKSSVWNKQGHLLGQLNSREEGILMLDTESQEIITKHF